MAELKWCLRADALLSDDGIKKAEEVYQSEMTAFENMDHMIPTTVSITPAAQSLTVLEMAVTRIVQATLRTAVNYLSTVHGDYVTPHPHRLKVCTELAYLSEVIVGRHLKYVMTNVGICRTMFNTVDIHRRVLSCSAVLDDALYEVEAANAEMPLAYSDEAKTVLRLAVDSINTLHKALYEMLPSKAWKTHPKSASDALKTVLAKYVAIAEIAIHTSHDLVDMSPSDLSDLLICVTRSGEGKRYLHYLDLWDSADRGDYLGVSLYITDIQEWLFGHKMADQSGEYPKFKSRRVGRNKKNSVVIPHCVSDTEGDMPLSVFIHCDVFSEAIVKRLLKRGLKKVYDTALFSQYRELAYLDVYAHVYRLEMTYEVFSKQLHGIIYSLNYLYHKILYNNMSIIPHTDRTADRIAILLGCMAESEKSSMGALFRVYERRMAEILNDEKSFGGFAYSKYKEILSAIDSPVAIPAPLLVRLFAKGCKAVVTHDALMSCAAATKELSSTPSRDVISYVLPGDTLFTYNTKQPIGRALDSNWSMTFQQNASAGAGVAAALALANLALSGTNFIQIPAKHALIRCIREATNDR